MAAVEDTGEIDEECECWPDDDDSGTDTSETWVLSVEGNNMTVDAEFLPVGSACGGHTCPWSFAEGTTWATRMCGSEREWSLDFSGSKVIQSERQRDLLSVGKLTGKAHEEWRGGQVR